MSDSAPTVVAVDLTSEVGPRGADASDPRSSPRAADRWRRIVLSTGGAIGARAVAMLCTLLTIPVALRFLGTERYGVWITLTSAVGMLSFFDFGLGIGLQNRVAVLMGQGRLEEAGGRLRSTLLVLGLVSLLVGALLAAILLATPLVGWLGNRAGYQGISLAPVLVVIGGAFLLGLPLGLFSRLAFGVQQGWIAGVATSAGTAFTLVAVLVAARWSVDFTTFVALTVVPPVASQVLGYLLLARRVPGLALVGPVSWREGVASLREGSRFVLPQVAGAVLAQSPLVLLGTLSSPVHAAMYGVFLRLSLPFQLLQQLFLDQVWPAITESLHGGDRAWLRQALRRLTRGSLAFAGLTVAGVWVGLVLFFPLLTRTAGLHPSPWLLGLYALHVAVLGLVQAYAYVANGLGRVRRQNFFAVVCVAFSATALPFFTREEGTAGMLAALLVLNGAVGLPLLFAEYAAFLREEKAMVPARART